MALLKVRFLLLQQYPLIYPPWTDTLCSNRPIVTAHGVGSVGAYPWPRVTCGWLEGPSGGAGISIVLHVLFSDNFR